MPSGELVDHEHREERREREQQWIERRSTTGDATDRGKADREHHDEQPVGGLPPVLAEVEGRRRHRGQHETDQREGQPLQERARPAEAREGVRCEQQKDGAGGGQHDRGPEDGRGDRIHEVVAQQPVGVRPHEHRSTVSGGTVSAIHPHAPSLHRFGHRDREKIEHRRGHVGERDETRASGRRRSKQTGSHSGPTQPCDGHRPVAGRGHRRDDQDRVTREIDVGHEPREEAVAPREGVAAHPCLPLRRCIRGVPIGSHQIRGFDERDRSFRPAIEERLFHLGGVQARAVRCRGVSLEEPRIDDAVGHPAVLVDQCAYRRPEVDRCRATGGIGLPPVSVRDDLPRVSRGFQRVAESTGLRVVEQLGVGGLDARHAEVDDPVAGKGAGALPVDLSGRLHAEPFRRREALSIGRVVAGCACPGTHRHVGGTELRRLAVGAGREIGDGGRVEEPEQVGRIAGLEIAPRERGHRHDEDSVGTPCAGRRRSDGGRRCGNTQHDEDRDHEAHQPARAPRRT